MERKREVPERCFLEVFRESKPPNSKSSSKWYFMACGIKKKKIVVTLVLELFLLFLGFLSLFANFGYRDSWTCRAGDSITFWVKHGVGSQR